MNEIPAICYKIRTTQSKKSIDSAYLSYDIIINRFNQYSKSLGLA